MWDSKKSAWEFALKLLEMKAYSKAELKNKLLKNFPTNEIELVLQKLIDMNYIVDYQNETISISMILKEYIQLKSAVTGKIPSYQAMATHLLKKGFEIEQIENCLRELQESLSQNQ